MCDSAVRQRRPQHASSDECAQSPALLVRPAICARRRRVKPSSDERLNKQAGPGTKGLPLSDMWQRTPPSPPPPSAPHSSMVHSYWSRTEPFHIPLKAGAKRWWSGGREGGGARVLISIHRMSPPYKRGPHDTATKSELMDSFLSPANMTGGVCVRERERACGRGSRGRSGRPFAPFKGHMGQ